MALAIITGASGFLGRHVHENFTACGIETLGVARRGGEYVDHLVRSYQELEDETVIGRPHQECDLIHLAGEPRVGQYQTNVNLAQETCNLSKALASLPWRRTILASSGAIYRPAGGHIRLDETSAIAETAYAQSKNVSEQYFLEKGGTALRLTNLMGDGMSDETIIADILKQVLPRDDGETTGPGVEIGGGVEIELRDCSAVVDLLLVSEAAQAFRSALTTAAAIGKTFNVGSGGGLAARELAELILKRLGRRLAGATSKNNERNLGVVLNTDLAATIIGWRPAMSFEAALSTFIPALETR